MNKKRIIEKIKSSFIYNAIFKYFKNPNFKYKLFIYSKLFQKKFGFKLSNYQELYFQSLPIKWKKYISIYEKNNYNINNYDKDILNKNLQEDLLKYKIDINIMKLYIDYYCKKELIALQEKYKGEDLILANQNEIIIDIFSPFFEFLSGKQYFNQLFIIKINENLIEKYNLINDYIAAFEKLNRDNIRSLIFEYCDFRVIDYIKKFCFNLSKIEKIKYIKCINSDDNQTIFQNNNTDNDNYILKNMFLFFNFQNNAINIENNLLVLKINLISDSYIKTSSIEIINKFNLLEYLELKNIILDNDFTLELFNLKKIFLSDCSNFTFAKDSLLKLNTLFLNNCFISDPESLLECPNLEICTLEQYNQRFYLFFDFSSFKKLKYFCSDINNFIELKDTVLEDVDISSDKETPLNIEIEMFKKILSIKTLIKIKFELVRLKDVQLAEIKGVNDSVKKIDIIVRGEISSLYYLQKKFPNMSNGKLVDIKYKGGNIINIKQSFPIFSDNCKVKFNNLTNFNFSLNGSISFNVFENIYNNLDNMPNLKFFKLDCDVDNIDRHIYDNFIQKILKLNLEYAFLWIRKKNQSFISFYKKEELVQKFPNIDVSHLKSFVILKI